MKFVLAGRGQDDKKTIKVVKKRVQMRRQSRRKDFGSLFLVMWPFEKILEICSIRQNFHTYDRDRMGSIGLLDMVDDYDDDRDHDSCRRLL